MSKAEDLLNSLTEPGIATLSMDTPTEPHIVINYDKTLTVPADLKHVAVVGEHNSKTVIFDCPRYWGDCDLSTMSVQVIYRKPGGKDEPVTVTNLRVDELDESLIHFDWTLTKNVTATEGYLTIMVCARDSQNREWHSRINRELFIDEGLTCS